MKKAPNKIVSKLLEKLLPEHIGSEGIGDFLEVYHSIGKSENYFKADLWYIHQVIRFFFLTLFISLSWGALMFTNYFKTAFRQFSKNKMFSSINIMGLTIGIVACLMIVNYVMYEFSYDKFHENINNIYRLRIDSYNPNGTLDESGADCVAAAGRAVTESYPEVIDYVKFCKTRSNDSFTFQNITYNESRVAFASESFFKLFSFKLIKGNRETVLDEVNTVVISESIAEKYFGSQDPVGKVLKFNGNMDLMVTGVYEDMPGNSHFHLDVLISFKTMAAVSGEWVNTSWAYTTFYTYVLLQPEVNIEDLEKNFDRLTEEPNKQNLVQYGFTMNLVLQPLEEIHLNSRFEREAEINGSSQAVYALLLIACSILLIAWFNYINLSTARVSNRASEVGLRKVFGAHKKQLIRQFISESALTNSFAFILSVIVFFVLFPYFNNFAGIEKSYNIFSNAYFWLIFTSVFIAGSLVVSFYPALVLSSFTPASVLKGKSLIGGRGRILRKALVVFQFSISIILIIGTMIVFKQLTFMLNKDLGVDKDQIVVVKRPVITGQISRDDLVKKVITLKSELENQSGISNVSFSSFVPSEDVWLLLGAKRVSDDKGGVLTPHIYRIDENFIPLYGLSLVSGKGYQKESGTNYESILINESAVELFGFQSPEECIGEKILFRNRELSIIGVIKNYNQEKLHENYEPTLFLYGNAIERISIKLSGGRIHENIDFIKSVWADVYPGSPFSYFFLDDNYDSLYKSEEKFGSLFGLFSTWAIFVACLGLFGLASFTVSQKTREIGLRKVLGAKVHELILMISRQFLVLIVLANIIAYPVAWYFMNQWLTDFAFKTNIGVEIFILASLIALAIGFSTIIWHVTKSALANPVDALRDE